MGKPPTLDKFFAFGLNAAYSVYSSVDFFRVKEHERNKCNLEMTQPFTDLSISKPSTATLFYSVTQTLHKTSFICRKKPTYLCREKFYILDKLIAL